MNSKDIVIYELKSNQGTPLEFVSQRVVVKRERDGSEPVFHWRCNVSGYALRDELMKDRYYRGRIFLPLFDAIVRVRDLKVLKYRFYKLMKDTFKKCNREKWMEIQCVNAQHFDSLTGWLGTRVSRRHISTHWDRLLDAWNELNPENKLAYFDKPAECRGVLEYLVMGRFKESGEKVEYHEEFDYSFHVLSHVTDYCPESTREIFIKYKDKKRGGFEVSVDVQTFQPLWWVYGKASQNGKITPEHYEKIRKFLCECDCAYYFKRMFYELDTFGRFDARKYYGQYTHMKYWKMDPFIGRGRPKS